MSTKRDLILSSAKALFVEHGISGTTIASIASNAGIAKGSVYSYFKSKQDIVHALLTQLLELSQLQLEQLLTDKSLAGVSLIEAYINHELSQVSEERALTQAIAYDDSAVMDDDAIEYIQSIRATYYQNQLKLIANAYAELDEKWHMDVIALLNGALQEYSIYIALDNAQLTLERCAKVISAAIDAVIGSFSTTTLEPALTPEDLPLYHDDPQVRQLTKAKLLVSELKNQSNELATKDKTVVNETLTLLETQLEQDILNSVLLRALIANLAPYKGLSAKRAQLAELLDVELI
ncbi:TetR/AcrR family transcriptional regulator [Thalassotalea marina]|uniref:HTH tetR-type domain-containing protein n=1 Tax=Thalassotalea marina TaxID=1673741 RepID=A0A919BMV3_9GAMM|nr:TetR/AcrR family transcriptional regulator [Thalassotalea marina]GHG01175.1 hypothetical protein GCM10017161_32270 [Thalassotalea marina]